MLKIFPLFVILSLASSSSQTETRVLNIIQAMLQTGAGISFTQLHNDPRFNKKDKEFVGRLFEIFFRIPNFIEIKLQSTGNLPNRGQIGDNFGIGVKSVDLLLTIMSNDPRVPKMFERDRNSGEIISVNRELLKSFIRQHSSQIRVTGWEGEEIPNFTLPTLDGKQLSKKSLLGSSSLLYFWFTGCPPCARIAPILEAIHRKYGKDRLKVVGLNADMILKLEVKDQNRVTYLKNQGISFPNLLLNTSTHKSFGSINVFPTLFLINSSGKVVQHLINYQSMETIDRLVSQLVDS